MAISLKRSSSDTSSKKKKRQKNPASARKWAITLTVIALAIWAFFTYLFDKTPDSVQSWFQVWLPPSTINESLVWVICALGLNIVVGYAGLLDLGFVAFWAFGGYAAGWFMSGFFHQVNIHFGSMSANTIPGIHLSFWIVMILAALIAGFFGIIIGAPTLRLKSDYLALVTLGFGEIIPQVFTNGENIGGFNLSNGTKGISPVDAIGVFGKRLGPFDLGWKFLIYFFLAACMVFVSLRIRGGRLGRAWLAIREDELAASMMGVPLMRTKLTAYAVGAFSGGIGGAVYATHVNGIFAERFNFSISIILLAMVVLGGMGNVWGVIVGALLMAWINASGLPAIGETFNNTFNTNINFPSYNFLLFGGILVLMMLFKRDGLLPEARLKMISHENDDETSNTGGH